MDVKEYLSQAFSLDKSVNSKLRQLEDLNSLTMKITQSYVASVDGTKPQGKIDSNVPKIIDLKNEINEEVDRFVDLKKEIFKIIKQIKNPDERVLFELRYLCYLSWEQIAERMGYTSRHVQRLHNKSLEILGKTFENR